MSLSFKNSFMSNAFLKIVSIVIGYNVWSITSETFTAARWHKVPVCFYNTDQTSTIKSPEYLWVQLKGRRSKLSELDTDSLGIHIDAHQLKQGPNTLELTGDHLFLPTSITLQEYKPQNILIHRA